MFGWKREATPKMNPREVAAWLANHAAELNEKSTRVQTYVQAAVLLETEDADRRAFVDDLLGQ